MDGINSANTSSKLTLEMYLRELMIEELSFGLATEMFAVHTLVRLSQYDNFEQELAMAIDDDFNPNKIYAYQLASFAGP
jgi:hypothetical protein